MKPEQPTTIPARTFATQTRATLIKTDPYASRTHRRIDVILLVVTIVILFLVLHASAHGQTVTLASEAPRHGGDATEQEHSGGGHHKKKPPAPPVSGDPVYTATNSTTDKWSAGTNWSATPTSGNTTQLTYNGASPYTNITNTNTDDFAGAFTLNILDLSGSGANSGTGSSITIAANAGSSLTFNGTNPVINLTGNAGNGMTYTVSAPITLGQNTLFTGDGTATFDFSGVISGTKNLTKSGTGVLTLSGANTYTGTTTVNAGTLFINGNQTSATNSTTVNNSGSVLGGSGTIGGAVTIAGGAILEGGTGSTGQTLTINGNVTMNGSSIIELALGPSLTHSTIAISSATFHFAGNQDFKFIELAGTTTGTYTGIITGVANPGNALNTWKIDNFGTTGTFSWDSANGGEIDLNLTAVPEPSTYFAAALAVFGVAFTKRKRFARILNRA